MTDYTELKQSALRQADRRDASSYDQADDEVSDKLRALVAAIEELEGRSHDSE